MLENILKKYSSIFYVQIWEHKIKVTETNSGNTFDEKPLIAFETTSKGQIIASAVGNSAELKEGTPNTKVINPFSHPRTLISNFSAAEKILQNIFSALPQGKFKLALPVAVIHPMEKIDGGLTQIEFRAFKELLLGAGCREAVIYQGAELNIPTPAQLFLSPGYPSSCLA
ncbi:MAG: rod shape-determining protein [gamma proteobacterium symbiont of Taylorina sp.]|nr:rod shape-determining protein [gamma proteobacterium symbiont of Taylorina sp.]